MQYGITELSVIPVRTEPSEKSEMATQLLFGDFFEIVEKQKNWVKIKNFYDGYEGWASEKQVLPISEKYFTELKNTKYAVSLELVQSATSEKKHIPILLGSLLHNFDGINFQLGKEKFIYNGQAVFPDANTINSAMILKIAGKYLNAPYLWGGRSPFGIDCSGFTQMVYKILGIALKRDAYQQAEQGRQINFTEETNDGDLAFFENEEGKISHTGIILKENEQTNPTSERKIIHSSGKVRIDKFDHFGIYNQQIQKYSHRLRIIKRIIS